MIFWLLLTGAHGLHTISNGAILADNAYKTASEKMLQTGETQGEEVLQLADYSSSDLGYLKGVKDGHPCYCTPSSSEKSSECPGMQTIECPVNECAPGYSGIEICKDCASKAWVAERVVGGGGSYMTIKQIDVKNCGHSTCGMGKMPSKYCFKGKSWYNGGYLCQPRVADEGNGVGDAFDVTEEDCKALCDNTQGCRSFTLNGKNCHLKDKCVPRDGAVLNAHGSSWMKTCYKQCG